MESQRNDKGEIIMRRIIALFLILSLSLGLASALAEQTVIVSGTGDTFLT